MRGHFRLMYELGFNCLKGLYVTPGQDIRQLRHLALDEGINPYYYGDAINELPTPKLLSELGIPADLPLAEVRRDPRYVNRQIARIRERIDRDFGDTEIRSDDRPRFPFSFDAALVPESAEGFTQWLQARYETVETLALAWNMNLALIRRPEPMWKTWQDVQAGVYELIHRETTEYRRLRDVLRFKADVYLDMVNEQARDRHQTDPEAPVRAGGEMGLFLPFASRATDMEGVADAMTETGSFYPSIHLAWHFEEVAFEVARPVYMQASLAADWFKGGWSATWESTGGPQQLSGGKGSLFPEMSPHTAGFTVDDGTMTQLMLSYLAAGFKGFGLWTWNARVAGWEAGEYALLDRQNRPSDRAIAAGKICRAANHWRDEIWNMDKEPLVGVFQDWDNEAMWAVMAIGGRDHFRYTPVKARIGVSRALINQNVPFEYVTANDLRSGLAGRYRAIYLPAVIALSADLLPILTDYARDGGHVVIDLPSAWYDEFGRSLKTHRGSAFESLFGFAIRDIQYSDRNTPRRLGDATLEGFVADLELTSGRAVESYDTGSPAVVRNQVGRGKATLLAFEASLGCYRPGNNANEQRLRLHTLGDVKAPFTCENAMVYRRAGTSADHYFLINDGPEKTARLSTGERKYRSTIDAISLEPVALDQIKLPRCGGRWIRCQK